MQKKIAYSTRVISATLYIFPASHDYTTAQRQYAVPISHSLTHEVKKKNGKIIPLSPRERHSVAGNNESGANPMVSKCFRLTFVVEIQRFPGTARKTMPQPSNYRQFLHFSAEINYFHAEICFAHEFH
jgi:hypothetical protein